MAPKDIKSEIHKLLDNIPENALQDLYNYLKEAEKQSSKTNELNQNLSKILREDKDLLKKLAQ
ncbi:hypothetical protein JKA74_08465 [Marivirga sp. S37H4]|uniref:Uncharacterized protein n=1 Tax=Marivirga aurantiaca TaxID=2802615 RepID=A0A934WXZ7_9BACT|nr:hypothetical protein [Marivirga aurantiaca]MBK6265069.1 hypothetical protein [Marivirga aurantiaca]